MIQTDYYGENGLGVRLVQTYSTDGKYIERDGIRYESAIDPEEAAREYTETDELIPVDCE